MNFLYTLLLYTLLNLLTPTSALLNPILPGWNPDPTILRVGPDYFISTSTFEYFPGHPIYHSRDLVNWTLIGHALNRPSQLTLLGTPSDAGAWAPGLRYHEGRFYLTSTVRYVYTSEMRLFPRSFFVWTEDIWAGVWSDPVYFDFLGYDTDLFFDPSGTIYATYSGINNALSKTYSIYQTQISVTTGRSLTPSKQIFTGTLPDNSTARPEGPHIYLINGTYYLLIAEGGTDVHHRATIQRGPTPEGPWESCSSNPVLFNGWNLSLGVQDTGHADMVEGSDGRWWGVALGVRPQGGNFCHIQLAEHIPDVLTDERHVEAFIDYFNGSTPSTTTATSSSSSPSSFDAYKGLSNLYYFLRTPYKPFHTFILSSSSSSSSSHPRLRLYASAYAPGDRDLPSLILRKQTSYTELFTTVLESFVPGPLPLGVGIGINGTPDGDWVLDQGQGNEAGVSVFYGDAVHNDVAVVGGVLPGGSNDNDTGVNINSVTGEIDSDSGKRYILTRTITLVNQVGPWALTSSNNTITEVRYTPLRTADAPVRFVVRAWEGGYKLGFEELVGDDDGDVDLDTDSDLDTALEGVTWTAEVDAVWMSVAPAGDFFFKGAAFGVYNTGNGKPSLVPADFRYWKQIPLV